MEQFETEMQMYPTNLRVETQMAGALLPQLWQTLDYIKDPDIQMQTEMLTTDSTHNT